MTETEIQSTICEYLAYRKHFFWRQNTAPRYDTKKQIFYRMPKHAMNGVPDIILIKDGQFIGLEVKQEKGKQSEDQKIFEKRCHDAGAKYYIVRSLDDVIKLGL